MQNAFGIAPTGLRTSLEHIPDHIKNLTKIDLLMMPTSNFAFAMDSAFFSKKYIDNVLREARDHFRTHAGA